MHAECGFHEDQDGGARLVESGPTVQVIISFDPSNYPPNNPSSLAATPPSIDIPALIDTGAKKNHIDNSVAKTLQLPVVNRRIISGSDGKHLVDVYLAQIHVPSLNETILGEFAGVKLIEGGSKYGAILGRFFLKNILMTYNGVTGQVTLTKT